VSDGETELKLNWQRCAGGWCLLAACDPPPHATGVYIIWQPLQFVRGRRAACVGQGAVRDRLTHHRGVGAAYYGGGSLLVTWAACPADVMDGVVRFLAAAYRPCEGQPDPRVEPVSVNLPI